MQHLYRIKLEYARISVTCRCLSSMKGRSVAPFRPIMRTVRAGTRRWSAFVRSWRSSLGVWDRRKMGEHAAPPRRSLHLAPASPSPLGVQPAVPEEEGVETVNATKILRWFGRPSAVKPDGVWQHGSFMH